mmetsp:Transcript_150939/g.274724  ORF Transcript_150939/g.274724 Transcript_150939/m.274724 type:complete len:86 (-) Transcript_150939:580-837(-)
MFLAIVLHTPCVAPDHRWDNSTNLQRFLQLPCPPCTRNTYMLAQPLQFVVAPLRNLELPDVKGSPPPCPQKVEGGCESENQFPFL